MRGETRRTVRSLDSIVEEEPKWYNYGTNSPETLPCGYNRS